MYHFGLEKGIVTDERRLQLTQIQLSWMRMNLLKTFKFILSKLEILFDFMDQGVEEVRGTSILEREKLDGLKKQILAYMNKFKFKCSKQLSFMMFQIYREQVETQNLPELIEGRITEESEQFKGIAGQIKTLMQFNRLHKIVSARACEYIYILRQCFSLVSKDFIALVFPKKNVFNTVDIEQNAAYAAQQATQLAIQKHLEMLGGD